MNTSENIGVYTPTPAVNLTASAIRHLKNQIKKHRAVGLRLGVKKEGCSGFKYVVDYVHTPTEKDQKFSVEKELDVYIDNESLPKVYGITIDYVQEGLNGKLKFNNPNEKNSCGCGESFSV